jgi:hypothetical protein
MSSKSPAKQRLLARVVIIIIRKISEARGARGQDRGVELTN